MERRRRGIFASFVGGFRDGYNRHSGHRGYRESQQSFIARQDAAYHRDKHRHHAAKHVGRMILGAVIFVIMVCFCGDFIGLW